MTPNDGTNAPVAAAPGSHAAQLALAIGVVLLGTALGYGALQLPAASGYAKVGPQLMPVIVSGGLIVLGLLLLKESASGGFRDVDEFEHSATPTYWPAFLCRYCVF